jgi:hypothetical protein
LLLQEEPVLVLVLVLVLGSCCRWNEKILLYDDENDQKRTAAEMGLLKNYFDEHAVLVLVHHLKHLNHLDDHGLHLHLHVVSVAVAVDVEGVHYVLVDENQAFQC